MATGLRHGLVVACVILSGMAQAAHAQDLVVRSNHNAVLRSEADTVAILRKGRAAGFRPSVLFGRVVTFRLTLGQMNAFGDSARAWPEFARNADGRLLIEWDSEVTLPPDSTREQAAGPLEAAPEWHIRAVHAPEAWTLGYDGTGILTAALDAAGGWGHPGVNIAGGWNAVIGADTTQGYQNDPNCNSHGIHTASSMSGTRASRVGVAPGSSVLLIRVFETAGTCTAYLSSTLRGAVYAADHGARLLNVSIAHGASYTAQQVASDLRARGVLFCGANGNSGATPTYWPANDPNAVGSGAVDAGGNRASWSNYGPTTDFGSPGVGVLGAMQGGGYGVKSGTSMASPTTCGAFAVLMSAFPTAPLDTLIAAMKATADSLPGVTPNDYTGWGRPNVASAIAALSPNRVKTEWTSRTYTALVTDSVMVACANTCRVTLPNGATIWQPTGYVRFTADRDGTLAVRDTGGVAPPPPPIVGPVVTLTPSTRYQTIDGWATTLRMWEEDKVNNRYDATVESYGTAVAQYLVDSVGINAVRLELLSGWENPQDDWTPFVGGGTYTDFAAGRYEKVNDNASATATNLAGYQFAALDYRIERGVLPMRAALAARGESLRLNVNYLDFNWNNVAQGPLSHANNPTEFAEFVLVYFQHLRDKYGLIPDSFEMILEPENTQSWRGVTIGNGLVAVAAKLAANGFHPTFLAPSTTNMGNAIPYFTTLATVPGAAALVSTLVYHRYGGESAATARAIRDTAAARGIKTAMLEKVDAGVDVLMEDLTAANVSGWQQWAMAGRTTNADNGGYYARVNVGQSEAGAITPARLTGQLAQVFRSVRRGAVRIGSTSTEATHTTAAFLNPDGRLVAIVRVRSAGAVNISGLPAGSYAVSFTTDAGVTTATVATVPGVFTTTLPAAGVLSVRGLP